MSNQANESELLLELKSFGLDPREWKLEQPGDCGRSVTLRHRFDSDLEISGRLAVDHERSVRWHSLAFSFPELT